MLEKKASSRMQCIAPEKEHALQQNLCSRAAVFLFIISVRCLLMMTPAGQVNGQIGKKYYITKANP